MAVLEATSGPRKGSRLTVEPGARLTLGRGERSDFILPDEKVSRSHAELDFAGGGGAPGIRDLGCKNGTFVTDTRGVAIELRDGDIVRLGESELRFRLLDARDCFCCRSAVLAGEEVWAEGHALCVACGREYAALVEKVADPIGEIARRKKAARRVRFDGGADSTIC